MANFKDLELEEQLEVMYLQNEIILENTFRKDDVRTFNMVTGLDGPPKWMEEKLRRIYTIINKKK